MTVTYNQIESFYKLRGTFFNHFPSPGIQGIALPQAHAEFSLQDWKTPVKFKHVPGFQRLGQELYVEQNQ
jgi:hypothetical protein